jgi:hypothetical protein
VADLLETQLKVLFPILDNLCFNTCELFSKPSNILRLFKPFFGYNECKIARHTGAHLFEIHLAEHPRDGADYSGFDSGAALDNDSDLVILHTYIFMGGQGRDFVSVCLAGL